MTNTDTLSDALDQCRQYLAEESKVVLSPESHEIICDTYMYGCAYGQVINCNVPIESLKGRKTSKYAHIVIERLCSGRYEPIAYVL